ncbi:site-specific DNA-methyltransferase [Spartobacteria bacterium LR76]|nr:site-specific DNA-methyltransferase [Spartobacteria bacterium LR76]
MDKLKLHTPDLAAANIEKLAALFPSCVTETRDENGAPTRTIDFDQLRQELSDHIVEGPRERYHLDWPGKREALLAANAPIAKTLRPCREESVDFDTTKNLFIEGDNLDALKLLQETYLGKVKMIYIDPPYNTGGDFLYEDDFASDKADFLQASNQRDEERNRMLANEFTNGRFHSDWLTSLFPRLKLARNLLRDDGVIFISIDDNEYPNLLKMCEEIFGDTNYCGTFIWEKKKKPSFLNANMGTVTEYIVAFARDRTSSPPFAAGTVEDGKKYPFNNAGNGVRELTFPAGSVQFRCADGTIKAQDMSEGNIITELLDDVHIKEGRNENPFRLRGEWRYSQEKLNEFVAQRAEIVISKTPFRPNYINRSGEIKKTANLLSHRTNGVPTNEDATEEIRSLFGADVMSHPKPTGLLRYLVRAVSVEDDIVMDFYAGSGTTAHSVIAMNAEDGGSRRFILVQLDEACEKDSEAFRNGYATIANLAKERVRRAGKQIKEENRTTAPDLDCGFRVLKIDTSNMTDMYYAPDSVKQDDLVIHIDNIKPDRTADDLLFQVLVDWGVDLSLPITKEIIGDKTVFFVDGNALVACFDSKVGEDLVKELAKSKPLRVIFRDSGFDSDSVKINMEQIFKLLSPGTEIRSL